MNSIPACDNCSQRNKKHTCCKQSSDDICELSTITASQISSAIVFFVFVLFNIFSHVPIHIDKSNLGEAIIRWEIFIGYFLALTYYFFGSWEAEEDLIDQLRQLHPLAFYLQWILRIIILMVFGLYSNIIEFLDRIFGLFHIENDRSEFLASIIYLAFIFFLFSIWDIFVFLGGKKEISKQYFVYDFGGALLISGFAASYFFQNYILLVLSIIGFIVLVIFIGKLIIKLNPLKSVSRVKLIKQIR